ncbi:ABC transporter permease [Microbacterium sp.]|uniref:ABC transporter permease n=1 Tax=Microbacterium sp. TaxID=51671 RepID=UPI003D6F1345
MGPVRAGPRTRPRARGRLAIAPSFSSISFPTRRHVAEQFLLESLTIGFFGGLVGTAVGVTFTVMVSGLRDWTPLLDLRLAVAAPLLGATIGLAAGTYGVARICDPSDRRAQCRRLINDTRSPVCAEASRGRREVVRQSGAGSSRWCR